MIIIPQPLILLFRCLLLPSWECAAKVSLDYTNDTAACFGKIIISVQTWHRQDIRADCQRCEKIRNGKLFFVTACICNKYYIYRV